MTLIEATPAAAAPVTLGDRSNEGSSAAVFNGKLHLAYIGTNRDNTLNITSSSDGQSFSTSQIAGNSNFSPSITAYNGRLYLAWAAKNSFRIQVASSSDGVNFSTPVPTTFTTQSGPALGVEVLAPLVMVERCPAQHFSKAVATIRQVVQPKQ